MVKLTQERVIEQFKEGHKHELDRNGYSKVVYLGEDQKVEIICNRCNVSYWQSPTIHKRGSNHDECSGQKHKLKPEDVLKEFAEAHKHEPDKYKYPNFKYEGNKKAVKIWCTECNEEFEQTPEMHKAGFGHRKCGPKIPKTKKLIEECSVIHNDHYGYDRFSYVDSKSFTEIYCKRCNIYFPQKPYEHKRGRGCPFCKNKTELKVKEFLDANNIKNIHQATFPWCKVKRELPYDFLVNDTLYEIDGEQHFRDMPSWHQPFEYRRTRDVFKTVNAVQNNRKVVRIFQEDIRNDAIDWKNIILQIISGEIPTGQVTYVAKDVSMYNSLDTQLKDHLNSYPNAIKYIFKQKDDDIDDE